MKAGFLTKALIISALSVMISGGIFAAAANEQMIGNTSAVTVSAEEADAVTTGAKADKAKKTEKAEKAKKADRSGKSAGRKKNGKKKDKKGSTLCYSYTTTTTTDDKNGSKTFVSTFCIDGSEDGGITVTSDDGIIWSVIGEIDCDDVKAETYIFDEDEIREKMSPEDRAEYDRINKRIAEIDELVTGGRDDISDEKIKEGYSRYEAELTALYDKMNDLFRKYFGFGCFDCYGESDTTGCYVTGTCESDGVIDASKSKKTK